MTPFREDLWNLPEWMYPIHWALVILCGVLLVYGLWRRVRLWRMGQPADAHRPHRPAPGRAVALSAWASAASCPSPTPG